MCLLDLGRLVPSGTCLTWIVTAATVSAAASFWCTRRCFSREFPARRIATPVATPSTPVQGVVSRAMLDDASYLCTRCGVDSESPVGASSERRDAQLSTRGPLKLVLLVRSDINMGKGKAAAQCCHAVLAAYKTAASRMPELLRHWEREGQPKVTLRIDSEAELMELMAKARTVGICAESIRDAGRTQLAAGTRTVCAIGPAPASLLDTITGHLKLY